MLIPHAVRVLILSAGWLLSPGAGASEPPIAVAPVAYQTVPKERTFDAVIEAVRQSTVSAQTSGRIVEIHFDVDDYVEQGEILLRFSSAEQRARLKEAEARYTEAQEEYERTQKVYDKKVVPKSTLDKATADLKAARSRVDEAREQFKHTVVKAPYSGILVERHVELGETANPGQPLVTGLSLEDLRAVAQIPQSIVDSVRVLGKARIIVADRDRRAVDVVKMTVFPRADPRTHTFKMRADLARNELGLFPGMFVKLVIVEGEEQRLWVPADAVVYRSEVTAVYVVESSGAVSFRQIRVGRSWEDGRAIEVLAGLDEGEQVALDPVRAGILLKRQRQGAGE